MQEESKNLHTNELEAVDQEVIELEKRHQNETKVKNVQTLYFGQFY